ncbi:hypothetical protein EXE59_22405 [Nocardioides eburneiflavus]|uniref:Terpene cyclase/mutase family protein n=1 Tax=Nocardioides eburneiflavus TaxID=2518372 RepID=A0A4Z1CN86_9ACTN|nr:terpene cyclase/mutase family protein [Nocardioides eburneiflavus]TGN66398.1 hypothetical protein EXE59_22405 [Nocardioides eburneiflavus]
MKLTPGLASATVAVTLTATLTATLVNAAPATAAAGQSAGERAVSAGATWLQDQLTGGVLHNEEYDFDDLGLSADIAFALDVVGGHEAAVTQVVDAIEPDVEKWVAGFPSSRVYAGSVAKMVAVVQAADRNPESYNGTDQVDRLEGLVSSEAPVTGRLQDAGVDPADPFDADFVNVISQSFAVRALTHAGSPRAGDATAFLLEQQCNAGFFRAALTVDKTATDQGCDPQTDTGEVDTTALAVINILGTPEASTTARGAAHLAASWLRSQQAADGSFSAGALGINSNTTGLAGWALAVAGHDGAATKAAAWLRGVQVADLAPCASVLSADNGAVAYKPADLTTARTAGSFSVPLRELARRATAQALPALAHVPAGSEVSLSAPATAVEKSTVTVSVAGLGAGEPACVSLGGRATPVTGTGSVVPVTFTLPAGALAHTFRVTTLTGSATATTATTAATATPVAPVAPSPVVGDLAVAKVEKVGRNDRFKVAVACDGVVACAGKLKVRTAGKVERADGTLARLVVAKSAYSVEPGRTARVTLRLTKPARAVLGKKRMRVVATQTVRGAEPVTTKFWLRRK